MFPKYRGTDTWAIPPPQTLGGWAPSPPKTPPVVYNIKCRVTYKHATHNYTLTPLHAHTLTPLTPKPLDTTHPYTPRPTQIHTHTRTHSCSHTHSRAWDTRSPLSAEGTDLNLLPSVTEQTPI